jgi:uncharacterized membrane protein
MTTFDVPEGVEGTYPYAINAKGAIAGSYVDSNGVNHGFARAPGGKIETFDPNGSTGTFALGINAGGVIAGSYEDGQGVNHGFTRTP